MYYKRIYLSFKLCIHLMKLYIFEAFLLLGSGYKRHIFMRIRIPNTKNKSIEQQKKVLQWVLVYGLSKSVLRSRSWYFLVRAGAGVKIWRQKHFFYYFLAYFYMKRSRSPCKKNTWSRSWSIKDRLRHTDQNPFFFCKPKMSSKSKIIQQLS